ncbi:hypothetical protein Bca52824_015142 [Brassica carinata]|uniref:DUF659 domain-containing protein n=1 Tax=Brassica carinata TaxID=52824 RepID=A0A8X7W1H3_BRACI|nr:hypothetical protein Bca52824_015142 [Brassica carinata]
MSEAGATRREVDPGRKYGIMLNNNSNSWKCIFCKKDFNAGISRLKQHLRGGHRNAKVCNLCPPYVREELIKHKKMKEDEIAARNLALQEEEDGLGEYDEESREGKYVTVPPPDILQGRRDRKSVLGAAYDKECREDVCGAITRWFLDAGLAFSAVNYPSFDKMVESIGKYGVGLKPPSMYELRVPLLNKEVHNTLVQIEENKKEWASKGCSLMSDGWRDSVAKKDIVNFLVNSPKGSVFMKSTDVSEVVRMI